VPPGGTPPTSTPPTNVPPSARDGTWTNVRAIEALERARQSREKGEKQKLPRFGDSFFERSREELSQSTDAVVPDDYQLVSGDQLDVITYNTKGGETMNQLSIDQRGEAYLPGAGPVYLEGLTPSQAESRLTAQLSSKYPNMRTRVSMTRVRKIRVFVIGESRKPGGYLMNPGATVLDALLASGGPSLSGSFRRLELQRAGRIIETFDLYNLLVKGKTGSPRLLEGDRVFIPIVGSQVAVAGEVLRPALYEIRGETTLAQIIKLAGGIRPDAYKLRAQIERAQDNRERRILDVEINNAGRTRIQSGDFITLLPILDDLTNGVYLDGAVKRPGWYSLSRGMRVTDLILAAQGMRDGAFPGHAEVYRFEAPDRPLSIIGFELNLALKGDPKNNFVLAPQDRVVVYDASSAQFNRERVRIQGEISRPGEYPRVAGMKLRDLLYQAGGVTPDASNLVEIVRRDSEGRLKVATVDLAGVLASTTDPGNLLLGDLDSVMVRRELRARQWPATVTLGGEVVRPGVYAIDPTHESLRELINRAGGLTERAYPKAAVLLRRKEEIIRPEHERLTKEVFDLLQDIAKQYAQAEMIRQSRNASLGPGQNQIQQQNAVDLSALARGSAVISPRSVERILSSGRIPLNIPLLLRSGKGDPGLRDGDEIHFPVEPNTVIVSGAVVMPTAILYRPGKSPAQFIERAGGLTDDGDEEKILVMRVNGELLRASLVNEVEPGDIVLVPPKAIIAEPPVWERFLTILQTTVNGLALWQLFAR